jgi:hypothetical protein
MTTRRTAVFLVVVPVCTWLLGSTTVEVAAQGRTRHLVLVTLDGARTQEIFGGLDLDVLRSTLAEGADPSGTDLYRRYWAATPEERRARLMPFLWERLLAEHGSIAGNQALGSRVLLTNRHRFSYPGYSEILTGQAHDDVIESNDPVRNPFPTVLEFLKRKLSLPASQVAAFASWSVFNWIVEHEEGAITVNAGFEPYDHPDPRIRLLSSLQTETPTPWDTVRHDAYTFHFAVAHLRSYRPRVLYLALGDDDDWAHDGRYDRYLDSLARADRYLERLWAFVQGDEQYRDSTTVIITVDHGRGRTPADWTDHGEDVEGAQDVWLVVASPDVPLRGEWRDAPDVSQNQIAATLARFLGFDLAEQNPEAGEPIGTVFEGW